MRGYNINMDTAINWYIRNKDYINFAKDLLSIFGIIMAIVGFSSWIKMLFRKKLADKRMEMNTDMKTYSEFQEKLKTYIDDFELSPNNMLDVGIRLLYMKNYPYNLEDDGYKQCLYYYFFTDRHGLSGYISNKGVYIVDWVRYMENSIYYNPKNRRWFVAKKDKKRKRYIELKQEYMIKRIPFSNIYGYDFESDWSEKGEPVLYTKYKYTNWQLYGEEIVALNRGDGKYDPDRIFLKKSKRAKRIRIFVNNVRSRILIKRTINSN